MLAIRTFEEATDVRCRRAEASRSRAAGQQRSKSCHPRSRAGGEQKRTDGHVGMKRRGHAGRGHAAGTSRPVGLCNAAGVNWDQRRNRRDDVSAGRVGVTAVTAGSTGSGSELWSQESAARLLRATAST